MTSLINDYKPWPQTLPRRSKRYSRSTMHTIKTRQMGKSYVAGLSLPVLWHPQQASNVTFPSQAKQLQQFQIQISGI